MKHCKLHGFCRQTNSSSKWCRTNYKYDKWMKAYLFTIFHRSSTQYSHFTHCLFLQSFHWISLWPKQLANKIELVLAYKAIVYKTNMICIRSSMEKTREVCDSNQKGERWCQSYNSNNNNTVSREMKKKSRMKKYTQNTKIEEKKPFESEIKSRNRAPIWHCHFTIHTLTFGCSFTGTSTLTVTRICFSR